MKHFRAKKHTPDIEELYQRTPFVISRCTLEGLREDEVHILLEQADIVTLDIFKDTVKNVHICQSVSSLVLNRKQLTNTMSTYIHNALNDHRSNLVGRGLMQLLSHLSEISDDCTVGIANLA